MITKLPRILNNYNNISTSRDMIDDTKKKTRKDYGPLRLIVLTATVKDSSLGRNTDGFLSMHYLKNASICSYQSHEATNEDKINTISDWQITTALLGYCKERINRWKEREITLYFVIDSSMTLTGMESSQYILFRPIFSIEFWEWCDCKTNTEIKPERIVFPPQLAATCVYRTI